MGKVKQRLDRAVPFKEMPGSLKSKAGTLRLHGMIGAINLRALTLTEAYLA
jgi:hypothetical protein